MVHVASEMEREGFDIPLLIGGATTSRVHTAVKIHPRYNAGQTVYVTDASRAVGVVSSLLSPETKAGYVETVRAEYTQGRGCACAQRGGQAAPAAGQGPRQCPQGRLGGLPAAKTPSFLGTRVFENWDLAELASYIDWTPFFQTWETEGPLSRRSSTTRRRARPPAQLFDDAQAMLAKIIAEKWFAPKAVVGFWPANAVGDDIRLFTDESRATRAAPPSSRCASS